MKVAQIKKLLMKSKNCVIYTGQQGQQWIGDYTFAVRVDDGLRLTRESIKGLFDLDTEQAEKLNIGEEALEEALIWPEMRRTQNRMDTGGIGINNHGGVEPLSCDGKLYLAAVDKIKAAVDAEDYREFYLGWDRRGAPLIIVMDGMMFQGIIRPLGVETCKELQEYMRAFVALEPKGWQTDEEEAKENE